MVTYCSAYNCKQKRGGGFSFHKFPDDKKLNVVWCRAVRRKNFKPTKHSKLCSGHFTPDSYVHGRRGHPTLKKNAVPTIFDYNDSITKPLIWKRKLPALREKYKTDYPDKENSNDEVILNEPSRPHLHSTADESTSSELVISETTSTNDEPSINETEITQLDFENNELSLNETADNEMQFIKNALSLNETKNSQLPSTNNECNLNETSSNQFDSPDLVPEDDNYSEESQSVLINENRWSCERKCYVGDFQLDDLSSPRKAKKFFHIANEKIEEKKKIILSLQKSKLQLMNEVKSLKSLVEILRRKNLVSEDAALVLKGSGVVWSESSCPSGTAKVQQRWPRTVLWEDALRRPGNGFKTVTTKRHFQPWK